MNNIKKDYKILFWNEMIYLIIIILILIGLLNVTGIFLNGNYITAGISFSLVTILFWLNFYIKYFIIYQKGRINDKYLKIVNSKKKILLPNEEQQIGNFFDRNNLPIFQIIWPFIYLKNIKKIILIKI